MMHYLYTYLIYDIIKGKKLRYKGFICLILSCFLVTVGWSQRDDIVLQKEKKAHSQQAIIDMKNGVLVLRLRTNHRKIALLEQNARSQQLKPKQRERYQRILEGTIQRRDQFNKALLNIVMDSFTFCPVAIVYDTSSASIRQGVRKGIFYDRELNLNDQFSIEKDVPLFFMNFQDKNSRFPFDVLLIQRSTEKLTEPFPYFVEVRESWINDVNTPGAVRAVARLDRKLWRYYDRVTQ